MMATIFNSSILNSAILDSAILHKTLTQTSSIWLKLIHSHSNWWYQPSWILPCWIQTLPSWIQTPCYLLSDSLKNTLPPLWLWLKLIQMINLMMATILAILPSWILPSWIQPFCTSHSHFPRLGSQFAQKTLTHSFWLNLMMAAILNSAMLDSDTAILDSNTLLSSLRFTQKHSPSIWLWLKLIQSD